MCWVIRKRSEELYEVGYYTIQTKVVGLIYSEWNPIVRCISLEQALKLCARLNGADH